MIEAKKGDQLVIYVEGGVVHDVMLVTDGIKQSIRDNKDVHIIDFDVDGAEKTCVCDLSMDEHHPH